MDIWWSRTLSDLPWLFVNVVLPPHPCIMNYSRTTMLIEPPLQQRGHHTQKTNPQIFCLEREKCHFQFNWWLGSGLSLTTVFLWTLRTGAAEDHICRPFHTSLFSLINCFIILCPKAKFDPSAQVKDNDNISALSILIPDCHNKSSSPFKDDSCCFHINRRSTFHCTNICTG